MTIRILPCVRDDAGAIDLVTWNGLVTAGVPVGTCSCGADAYGERIVRGHRLIWATAQCAGCGDQAGRPVRDLVGAAA